MGFPTTPFSGARLVVSASGSFGMSGRLHFLRRQQRGLQLFPRPPGRRLLRLLLGTTLARSLALARDQHAGVEALGVVGPVVDHLIARQLVEAAGGQLLEAGLVVLAAGPGRGLL